MLAQVGTILTGLGLMAALYATMAVGWSIRSEDERWWKSGRNGVVATTLLLGGAVGLLLIGFLRDAFEIDYVAQHSSRALPLYLKVTAVWGGQDGSLLLWAFLQALFGAMLLRRPSEESTPLVPWATVVMALITSFFVGMTLFLSNPFEPAAMVPVDGQGLNPLLRHPGMVFHPPALYLGYVGLAVPFALGMSALITRRPQGWAAVARSWTLAAWLFLGLGLLLGMRWAYDVLGWGGYWGWDPVENAGLMPWLTATALLHALVMDDQRRGFRWWSMTLSVISFTLVLFGTFTTRSGLIQSVHAFARSPLGPYFLAAMAVTVVGSGVLFYNRRQLMSTPNSSDELLSREGMFTITLILMLTITASVLVGSVLPTLTEALGDTRFEAGPEWFDRVTGPQFAVLVLVMGVCPLLGRAVGAWRRLGRTGLATLVGAVFVPAAGLAFGFTRPVSLVGFALVGLAGGTAVAEIVRGVATRRRRGTGLVRALMRTFDANRRRYGGYLVHLGVVLMALGVIGTRLHPFETEVVVAPGESVNVAGYSLTVEELQRDVEADRVATTATVAVTSGQRYRGPLLPRLDEYSAHRQTVAVPAVMSSVRQDLYVVLAGWSEGGSQIALKVFINPLASFLWLGGLVLMGGGAIALWPKSRPARVPSPDARRRELLRTVGIVVVVAVFVFAGWSMWGRMNLTQAALGPDNVTGSGTSTSARDSGAPSGRRPRVGEPAPEIDVELLDGSMFSLAEVSGQVAVVNFWSPDCKPCEDELPALQTVWEMYRDDGVSFVGISLPNLEEDVRTMLAEYEVTYPVALNTVAPLKYGITGVPETFVVDRDGTISHVHIGPITSTELVEELAGLLGG